METYTYDPKAGYQTRKCQVCNRKRNCCQHHKNQGRHTDEVIWVCDDLPDKLLYPNSCHKKIHANPKWAKENGYLTATDGKFRKKPSKSKMPEYINIDGFQTFLKKKVSKAKPLDFSKRGKKK